MWRHILTELAIVAVETAVLIGLTASIGVDRTDRPAAAGQEVSAVSPSLERSR